MLAKRYGHKDFHLASWSASAKRWVDTFGLPCTTKCQAPRKGPSSSGSGSVILASNQDFRVLCRAGIRVLRPGRKMIFPPAQLGEWRRTVTTFYGFGREKPSSRNSSEKCS